MPSDAEKLGKGRAEADGEMLDRAFVSTPEYNTLLSATHSWVIVGRRGTGKSALFYKLASDFARDNRRLLIRITPQELDIDGLLSLSRQLGETYQQVRAAGKLLWQTTIFLEVLLALRSHYKAARTTMPDATERLIDIWSKLEKHPTTTRTYLFSKQVLTDLDPNAPNRLTEFAIALNSPQLAQDVERALTACDLSATAMLDSIDEGWLPETQSTAFVSGLLTIASEADTRQQRRLRSVIFLRDNIHRAIEALDPDYSRNIEDLTLRLFWDEGALFTLVCARLRSAFDLQHIENDQKVWNRCVARGLLNRDGFQYCLRLTLYRPRDILQLLNQAFIMAAHDSRTQLIEADVDSAAKEISRLRLLDLLKEYDVVVPGIAFLCNSFANGPADMSVECATQLIEARVQQDGVPRDLLQHHALVGTKQIVRQLYGVGFVGLWQTEHRLFRFCHDGSSPTEIMPTRIDQRLLVHPCYWLALDCSPGSTTEDVRADIYDEHDEDRLAPAGRRGEQRIEITSKQIDVRAREVGVLESSLNETPTGHAGQRAFEEWARRAIEIVCAGHLFDVVLHPQPGATQQRDVVASNRAGTGFWSRFGHSFGGRQVIFEVKNYEQPSAADFRQLWGYLCDRYGSAGFLIVRSKSKEPNSTTLSWIREGYHEKKLLVMLLTDDMLLRMLRKLRSSQSRDYVDEQLSKLQDTYERMYLSLRRDGVEKRRRK